MNGADYGQITLINNQYNFPLRRSGFNNFLVSVRGVLQGEFFVDDGLQPTFFNAFVDGARGFTDFCLK